MSLLSELRKLKVTLPEVEVFVPEWNRSVSLRAMSVKDAKMVRQTTKDEEDSDRAMCHMLAYAIVEGDKHPLANEEGVDLLEQLSIRTLTAITAAYTKLNQAPDAEGNSSPRADGDYSSSDSLSPSAGGRLPN